MQKVRCVQQANAILGESPVWSTSEQVLYWVDIYRPAVYRFDPQRGQTGHWPIPRPVGGVALASANRLLVAGEGGTFVLDTTTGALTNFCDPEPDRPNRFNDVKVDRVGRFWGGTIDERFDRPAGSLYRIGASGEVHQMDTGFICSNGVGFSPDNRTLYFTDSRAYTIWAYDYDLSQGSISNRRVFASFDPSRGDPDGLTVDAEGYVWSALWDGWRIERFAPDGTLDRIIEMPVQRPTSCMFGGTDLQTLYVTSASFQLPWSAMQRAPLAGGLFAVDTGVKGLAETLFAG